MTVLIDVLAIGIISIVADDIFAEVELLSKSDALKLKSESLNAAAPCATAADSTTSPARSATLCTMDASTTEPSTSSTTSTPDLPPTHPSTTSPSSSASSFSSYTADLAAKVASLKASGLHGEPLYDHMTLMEAALCRTLLGEPCSEEESVAASCPSEEEEAPMSPTSVFSQQATSSPAWSTPDPAPTPAWSTPTPNPWSTPVPTLAWSTPAPAGSSAGTTPRSSESGTLPVLFAPCWSRGSSEGGAPPSPQEEQARACANLASSCDRWWISPAEALAAGNAEEAADPLVTPLPTSSSSMPLAAAADVTDDSLLDQYQASMLATQARELKAIEAKLQSVETDAAGRHSRHQSYAPDCNLRWMHATVHFSSYGTNGKQCAGLAFRFEQHRADRAACLSQARRRLGSDFRVGQMEERLAVMSERELRDVLIRHQAGELIALRHYEEWLQSLLEEQGTLLAAFGQLRRRVPGVEQAVQYELCRPGQARTWRGCKGMEAGSGPAWRR